MAHFAVTLHHTTPDKASPGVFSIFFLFFILGDSGARATRKYELVAARHVVDFEDASESCWRSL
jgi:hypothetical protein